MNKYEWYLTQSNKPPRSKLLVLPRECILVSWNFETINRLYDRGYMWRDGRSDIPPTGDFIRIRGKVLTYGTADYLDRGYPNLERITDEQV